ncbi:isopenicillin N synthase family dioxygenase [Jatrophihabitans sp. YIM 134969]
MSTALPVISLADVAAPGFDDALRDASHRSGFFYLTGHGIDPALSERLFAVARKFFALPDADKRAVEMLASPHFHGYTRLGGELTQGAVDWREQIDIGAERVAVTEPDPTRPWQVLDGPNLWPRALPALRPTVAAWEAACTEVAGRLLHAWARALGQDEDVFDAAFASVPSTLIKLIRYPGRTEPESEQGVGAHKDPGVLTLLWLQEGTTGLQVRRGDVWLDVPPLPGAFVVNTGELLEVATDGYLVATDHRVLSPPAGSERISVPFFFNPRLDATFPRLALPPGLAAQAAGVTQDPHNRISATFGENMLKARLRAHPDVAARHHPELVTRR